MSIIETIETRTTPMTVAELGSILGRSPKTLYKAIKSGRLPAYRIGGAITLDPVEVVAWLKARHTGK